MYPVHGFARPMRIHPMPGNAFAQQLELQRLRELDAAQRQRASSSSGDRNSYGDDSVRNLGRPVSSWSFVINNNNTDVRAALEQNQQQSPEVFLGLDPARAQSELQHVLLPEHDSALDGLSDLHPDVESPNFTFPERKESLPKRNESLAFRRGRNPKHIMTPRSGERTDGRDLGFTAPRRAERDRPTPLRYNNRAAENTLHRNERLRSTLVHPGNHSSQSNMPRIAERSELTPLRSNDQTCEVAPRHNKPTYSSHTGSGNPSYHTNMPTITERNQPNPFGSVDQSSKFTPHHIEHNLSSLVQSGDLSADSNASRQVQRTQPSLGHSGNLGSESTMPGLAPNNQPTLDHSAIPVLPRRNERNPSNVARPDSQTSEDLMPRRTPPARYAALTNQHTAPMPAHLTTTARSRDVTPQSQYVQPAAKNDAIMMSNGPMIPTRCGNYAATGMPRTVQGHVVTSMVGQVGSFPLSPAAPVFTPGAQTQVTIEQLIKRIDKLEAKRDVDRRLINQLLVHQQELRAEVEKLKKGGWEVEREIGDGWYNQQ